MGQTTQFLQQKIILKEFNGIKAISETLLSAIVHEFYSSFPVQTF